MEQSTVNTTVNTTVCNDCGTELNLGDWPFCSNGKGHGSTRPEWAQSFIPIIVDRDPSTGQLSYPGSTLDPVPDGYERLSLSTIQQADRFCRERTDEETQKRRAQITAEKDYFDQRTKDRRETIRDLMKKRGYKGKYFDLVCAKIDKQREEKYRDQLNREVHFFSDVFAFDGSNRNPHSDERTGWKSRKG